jgi:signal peptidase
MKMMSSAVSFLLFTLLLLMVFTVISSKASGGEPQVFGYQLKTVLSGSMEPTFQTGSIIAIKPATDSNSFKNGDVITFKEQADKVVTHRIVEVIKNGENTMYQTKGDNNQNADIQPVLAPNVIGIYTGFTIPYLGYFIDFAQSSKGTAILLILPGVLLLLYSVITIVGALRELDKTSKSQETEKTA